jgi:hypothetical protein
MLYARLRQGGLFLGAWLFACGLGRGQQREPDPLHLVETGQVTVAGHASQYLIRHLPVSSFPALPAAVQDLLNQRGCLIPQTYAAHRPENVVNASLERPGSSDWAVLCSSGGSVTLLVFFTSAPDKPLELASSLETERLQVHDLSGVLGFNWGIDPASPEQIREAQTGMEHRPSRLDHDALADSVVDHSAVYHFYSRGSWMLVDVPD